MMTILQALANAAARFPGKPAIRFGRSGVDYRELLRLCHALAGFLLRSGLRKGDTVAILLRKTPEAVVSFLGAAGAGGVPFSVDYNQTPAHIRTVLELARPSVLIVDGEFLNLLPPAVRSCGEGRTLIVVGRRRAGCPSWNESVGRAWPRLPDRKIREDDAFYLNFTSGSTGAPKAAVATYGNIYWNTRSAIETLGLTHEDVHLCLFPIFGHPHEIFARPLYLGGTIALVDGIAPRTVARAITEHKATCVMAAASIYATLLRFCKGHAVKPDSLRLAESGGMRVNRTLAREFKEHMGIPILPVWGSTETTGVALAGNDAGEDGCLDGPCRYYDARIVADNGLDCDAGEVGEMALRGPGVCREYYRDPAATAEKIRDGWFFSGDLAARDAAGRFHFAGRKHGMLKVAGMKVFPAEIETVLESHPAISEVAVVAAVDRLRGEAPKAVIVLKKGRKLLEADVRRYCEERLPRHKAPRVVEFVAKLPKSQIGKVLYRQLEKGNKSCKPR